MRYPKKLNYFDEIPEDVREKLDAIAKRFRVGDLHFGKVKQYLHLKTIQEVMDKGDNIVYRAAKLLNINYSTMHGNVERLRKHLGKKDL
jgi:DNA-binding ferritin-like protein